MNTQTLEAFKKSVNLLKHDCHIPKFIPELILDVYDKWGQYIAQYADTVLYIWRESVEFSLESKADKRHFPQASLDKMVEKHEGFYRGVYTKPYDCCPRLIFYFKRPEDC